jgi:hypothetical protein
MDMSGHNPRPDKAEDLLVIYKSIADRLRLRLNSSDFNIGSPLPGERWRRSSAWRA